MRIQSRFIFTTGMRPPVNAKRPACPMIDRRTQDLPLEAFIFAEDLCTFLADPFPGGFVVNCTSLHVLGYSRPTKGIAYGTSRV